MTALAAPIIFNNSTGSDTIASGSGSVTLNGTGASLNSTSAVDVSADAVDTSGITAGDLLWVSTSSGRQYSIIASVDSGTDIITCDDAFGVTESGRTWGIGGKRSTLDHADSRTLFADITGVTYEIEVQHTGTNYTLTSVLNIAATADNNIFSIKGTGATRPVIEQTANATCIDLRTNKYLLRFEFLVITCSNVTANIGIDLSSDMVIILTDCVIGDAVDQLSRGIIESSGSAMRLTLIDCEVLECTGDGIDVERGLKTIGCYIHDNGGDGIRNGNNGGDNCLLLDTIITDNGGSGYESDSGGGGLVGEVIVGCTIDGNGSHGIDLTIQAKTNKVIIINNNITGNGGFGVKAHTTQDTGVIQGHTIMFDNNNYGTGASANTSGAVSNITQGGNDLAVDPGYADAANGDYSVGTNLKAKAFPLPARNIGGNPTNGTKSFKDVGAAQREEPTGGSSPNRGILTGGRL